MKLLSIKNIKKKIGEKKKKNIEQNLTLENNISAPITAGQKLGEVSFSLNRRNFIYN